MSGAAVCLRRMAPWLAATQRGCGFLGLLLWLLVAPMPGQAQTLDGDAVSLDGAVHVLRDPSGALGIEDVRHPGVAKDFVLLEQSRSLGYVTGAIWLRFTLTQPDGVADRWWLDLNLPPLDEAQLFEPRANGSYTARAKVGAEHLFAQRDVHYRSPIYKLEPLRSSTPQTYYLRMSGNNSMVIAPRLWTASGFVTYYGFEQLFFGAFIAASLLLFFSSLHFCWSIRDGSYALLAAFIGSNLGHFLAVEGVAFKYLLPTVPGSSDVLMVLFWVPMMPLLSKFMLRYADLYAIWEKWAKLYIRLLWLVSAVTAVAALNGYFSSAVQFYQVWTLVQIVLHLLVLVAHAMAGHRRARIMIHAIVWLLIGSGLRAGRNLGLLPASAVTDYAFHWGFVAFLMVLYFAAIQRYQKMMKSKERAQAMALELSRQAEQKLALDVASRTAELNQALNQVETSLALERQAHEDQRQFFATVSHELRTPLAVINATALNLQMDMAQADEAARLRCGRILRATDQLAELVRNCFEEDRFNAIARGVRRETTDVRALIYDAHDAARLISPQHHLHVNVESLPASLVCDPELTRLALRTLASNAVKYTPAGTNVELLGGLADGGVVLEVRDDGPGVAARDLPKLFRRYYRGANAAHVPGTGLGLPLAREMIEVQGGTLRVESAERQGFAAFVWLPLPQPT